MLQVGLLGQKTGHEVVTPSHVTDPVPQFPPVALALHVLVPVQDTVLTPSAQPCVQEFASAYLATRNTRRPRTQSKRRVVFMAFLSLATELPHRSPDSLSH